jgi:hypothetical protein
VRTSRVQHTYRPKELHLVFFSPAFLDGQPRCFSSIQFFVRDSCCLVQKLIKCFTESFIRRHRL